jgi:hypothetical protein
LPELRPIWIGSPKHPSSATIGYIENEIATSRLLVVVGNHTDRRRPVFKQKVRTMAKQAGVWIDHKQAVVVLITGKEKEIKKITFDIGQPIRGVAGDRTTKPYKPGEFIAEDTLQRKTENDRQNYYDDVIKSFRGAKGLLVLGPGEAKGEFVKRLRSKKLSGVMVDVETVDKMTDRQIAAKVGAHFTPAKTKTTPTGRKVAKKKVTKAKPKKRKKKS